MTSSGGEYTCRLSAGPAPGFATLCTWFVGTAIDWPALIERCRQRLPAFGSRYDSISAPANTRMAPCEPP